MADTRLTTHLLSLSSTTSPLKRATTHDFLTLAGQGTLSTSVLTRWLVQDIHYTRGYIRFIGGLLSQLRVPPSIYAPSHSKTLHARIFDLLLSALNNIQRETQFFEDTAKEYGLELDMKAEIEPVTRTYVQCFDAVKSGSGVGGLLEGLTVLWATEHCYLTAWTHAKSQKKESTGEQNASTRALYESFIPNWTSPEFLEFVDQCADVLNAAASSEGLDGIIQNGGNAASDDANKEEILKRCEGVWSQVLYLEERFWPEV